MPLDPHAAGRAHRHARLAGRRRRQPSRGAPRRGAARSSPPRTRGGVGALSSLRRGRRQPVPLRPRLLPAGEERRRSSHSGRPRRSTRRLSSAWWRRRSSWTRRGCGSTRGPTVGAARTTTTTSAARCATSSPLSTASCGSRAPSAPRQATVRRRAARTLRTHPTLALSLTHPSSADAYRMWCTFEAVVVQQRRLPVQVAGRGVSATQRHVRRFGKYSFWLCGGDGVLDQLARMNAAFYVLVVCNASHLVARGWSLCHHCGVYEWENFLLSAAIAVSAYPIAWRFCLSMLPEARLAANARRVLRIMAYQKAGQSTHGLLRGLALLPAFDRRDALVVATLLLVICPELAFDAHAKRALAFSCYAATRLEAMLQRREPPCATMREWLDERGIHLAADGGGGADAEAVRLGVAHDFGLKTTLGVSCGLRSALGMLWTRPPVQHRWSLDGAVWGAGRAMSGDAAALYFLASSAAFVGRAVGYPLDVCHARPRCLTSIALAIINFSFMLYMVALDVPTWRQGFIPTPPFLPDKPWLMALLSLVCSGLAVGELVAGVAKGPPLAYLRDTTDCNVSESINDYVVFICLSYFWLLYQLAHIAWLYRQPASFLKGIRKSESILCLEPTSLPQRVSAELGV